MVENLIGPADNSMKYKMFEIFSKSQLLIFKCINVKRKKKTSYLYCYYYVTITFIIALKN